MAMYQQQSDYQGHHGNHRFNPHAQAYNNFAHHQQQQYYGGYGAADYGVGPSYQLNPALLEQQQQQPVYAHHQYQQPQHQLGSPNTQQTGFHSAQAYAAHQTSFNSSNNSFSSNGGSPAAAGAPAQHPSTKSRRNNPYASSNASNSEPSSPAVAPALAPASARIPADSNFFGSSGSSHHGSNLQSPVYAPDGTYGTDASSHPIAFSINEQFAQARGSLAATACTPRGRHMLVAALRQQHTDKIQAIFEELAPHIASLIIDPHGGHVVRTMIEFLNDAQIGSLIEFFTPEVVLTIATSSQNTRRVLQTLFERHRSPTLQPIIDVISVHAIALSTTQQGCIAVMRCLEHATENQKLQVLGALQPQLAALTMDPYGNYVVQAVLQYFSRETACEVIEKAFHGHWTNLSCNKFASNVMEKFIQAATPITRKAILEELVFNTTALEALMQDGFGNFVLQQIIDTCSTGTEFRKLADKIRPQLGTSPFGHKIEAKLKTKRFGPPYDRVDPATGLPVPGGFAPSSTGGPRSAAGQPNAPAGAYRGKKTASKDSQASQSQSNTDTPSSSGSSHRSPSSQSAPGVITSVA